MLPFPYPATNKLGLADWLELYALLAKDGNSSRGDLERALHRGALLDPNGSTAVEEKCIEVFLELEQRAKSADAAYPFEIDGGVVRSKSGIKEFPAYVFCLCVSFLRWQQKRGVKYFPRRMFEDLSCAAAQNFLHGDVVRFASPRRGVPKKFKEALCRICAMIGEGEFRDQPALSSKDSRVDVVAWRDFPDKSPGKLLLFGQCASGKDWEDKVSELQPEAFCKKWINGGPISPLIKAFFIPHRVDQQRWRHTTIDAGIIFDRCRIAYLVHASEAFSSAQQCINWCKYILRRSSPS